MTDDVARGGCPEMNTCAECPMLFSFFLRPADEFTEIKHHTMPINFRNEGGASLHPSGDRFIAGGSDLWVRVFDFATGEQMECLKVTMLNTACLVNASGVTELAAVRSCCVFEWIPAGPTG